MLIGWDFDARIRLGGPSGVEGPEKLGDLVPGMVLEGQVTNVAAFGAFVSLLPGKDGLVHISKLGGGKRIGKVEDVCNVGDKLQVEITEIDQRGKISLTPVQNDAPAAAEPVAAEQQS